MSSLRVVSIVPVEASALRDLSLANAVAAWVESKAVPERDPVVAACPVMSACTKVCRVRTAPAAVAAQAAVAAPAASDAQGPAAPAASQPLPSVHPSRRCIDSVVEAAPTRECNQAELLAMVAHELRKPLTPIRIAATLLRRAQSDPAMLAHVQAVIERQVDHMSRLVSDLLDTSRIRTGKLSLERRRVALADVVEAAIDTCRTALGKRLQRFEADLPAAAVEVDGDAVRLTQVLVNLLDNASKFTPENGQISLSLAARGDSAVIVVSDSGIGIAADEAGRIFEPFTQSPRATGFRRGGLGIGLSVVRELVEAHDGTIDARSAGKGLGSQFVVTLPLAIAASRTEMDGSLDDALELESR